jgi:hypothetical protein
MKSHAREAQLQEMEALAGALNVEVRVEVLRALMPRKGGLCRVEGKFVLFVDRRATLDERWQLFLDALCLFDLENLFVSPKLRLLMHQRREELEALGKRLPE